MSLPRPLIARFVSHLAEVQTEVAKLEDQLGLPVPRQADAVAALRGIAHKLAGTAEAYGFASLGRSARSLEDAITLARGDLSELAAPARRLSEALEDATHDLPA